MRTEYNDLIEASMNKDVAKISEIQMALYIERMKLDKFFSKFLDKFSDTMDSAVTDTPVWKLYKAKTKEYSELEQAIKASQYYLKKNNV